MPSTNCSVCGAPLPIGSAASIAECEYCGTSNQLQRESLKRQIDNDDEISPEQFDKLYNRAREFFEGQRYGEAFSILDKLIEYQPDNPALRCNHAHFFLFDQLNSAIGEGGHATESWKAECDHSGNGFYDDYTNPDFEGIFTLYNAAIDDVIELAGNDQEALAFIASYRAVVLERVKDMLQNVIIEFIDKYGHKVEKGTRLVERDGKTHSVSYTDYSKNFNAETIAFKMASDLIFFYCTTYLLMLEMGDLRPEDVDYQSIYSFLLYYSRNASLSYSGFFSSDSIEFRVEFAQVVPGYINKVFDYHLMADANAAHPLGSVIKQEGLCDYAQKLRDFASSYVQDGLLKSSEVEACVNGMDEIWKDARSLRTANTICTLCCVPVIMIVAFIPVVGLGMAFGGLIATVVMSVLGASMTGQADATLLKVTRNSERILRATAVQRKRQRLFTTT